MDELRPAAFITEGIEETIEVLVGLGPTLRREPRRFVEHEGIRVLVDHHLADELLLVLGQRIALWLGTIANRLRVERRHADFLPRFDPIARHRALAPKPQLARPGPARDDVEGDVGQVPLEPAVEPNAVVVLGNGESAKIAHAG